MLRTYKSTDRYLFKIIWKLTRLDTRNFEFRLNN